MEIERGTTEHAAWKPREAPRRDDEVGKVIFLHADQKFANEMRDSEKLVEQELKMGRNPEQYWQQLSAEHDTVTSPQIRRKVRAEMNALIPKLAEARVRRDAVRFSVPERYIADLERKLDHSQGMAQSAEGDPAALRSAIDTTRILREQIAEAKRAGADPDGWRKMRADAMGDGQTVEDLPAASVAEMTIADDMKRLQAERAGFKFWQFVKKAVIDDKIAELGRRLAFEAKKAETSARAMEMKRKDELAVPKIGDLPERAAAVMRDLDAQEEAGKIVDEKEKRKLVDFTTELLRMTMLELQRPMSREETLRIQYSGEPARIVPPDVRRAITEAAVSSNRIRQRWGAYGKDVLRVFDTLTPAPLKERLARRAALKAIEDLEEIAAK